MNADDAKKLSLPALLSMLGHEPVRETKGGKELWYQSPFRKEAEPSFHTSFLGGKWIWNDFGDIGGTVIDFVMRHQSITTVKGALAFLDRQFNGRRASDTKDTGPTLFSSQQPPSREAAQNFSAEPKLQFLGAEPVTNSLILSYLADERCIPPAIARRYLFEVKYTNLATGKTYFAFGMMNQSSGYEARIPSSKYSFKTALIARDISLIPGQLPGASIVHVFEGMTDFLSFLVLSGVEQLPDDAIVMHSLSSYNRAAAEIRARQYTQIRTYLDNDKAGHQGTERFKADFGAILLPQGERFAHFKDLNEALRARLDAKNSSNRQIG